MLLVPFEPATAHAFDPTIRTTLGAHLDLPLREAFLQLEGALGHRFDAPPSFSGHPLSRGAHRSLTAISLATELERAGLRWQVLDPGPCELSSWRRRLQSAARERPSLVGVSTTFITSRPWLVALLALVRRVLPEAALAVGGYYYTTSAEGFLSLDADIFCVGQGEGRLPEIARRVAMRRSLEDVPGLYLRQRGKLLHTGVAPELDLNVLPPPDWTLASRIDPPVAVSDLGYMGMETQRGCRFMCAFCTYRTLASPSDMSPNTAVERICALPEGRYVELYDATATSPRRRWKEICAKLAERGGSPLPIGAFARVSDIDAQAAELMQRAGVRHLYIGQESGDQRMLDWMRKGTRVSQVAPTLELLGRHGITVTFGLIHGFPGEDERSLAATRALLSSVNSAQPRRPTVLSYDLTPFALQDFAAVSTDPTLQQDRHHFLTYRSGRFSLPEICHEMLRTIVHTSRDAQAPVAQLVFQRALVLPTPVVSVTAERERIFRWAKSLERGVAIFIEQVLDGTRPDPRELDVVRSTLLEPFAQRGSLLRSAHRARAGVEARLVRQLQREWEREAHARAGIATRVVLAAVAKKAGRLLDDGRAEPAVSSPVVVERASELLSLVNRRYERKARAI